MNSRYKFRVWDKAEKNYGGFPFHLSQFGELERVSIDGTLLDTNSNRYVVEQCTGLKDKNGKLIFDGDIVRLSIDGSYSFDREVYYCEYKCRWFMRLCCSFECEKEYQYYDFSAEKARDLEIIGNIHEYSADA